MKRSTIEVATFFAALTVISVQASTCRSDSECPSGRFCKQPTGQCGKATRRKLVDGTCEPSSFRCTREYRPVCGCDKKSYSNECLAGAHRVSLLHIGDCDDEEMKRNGSPKPNDKKRPESKGGRRPKPRDRKRRPTPEENVSKVSKQNDQAIETIEKLDVSGTPCGGEGDATTSCAVGEYCHRPTGSCNGPGVCKPKPEICTMEYAPHCGCDGKTFGNRCQANSHGTSVLYEGECDSSNLQYAYARTKLSPVREKDNSPGNQIVPYSLISVFLASHFLLLVYL